MNKEPRWEKPTESRLFVDGERFLIAILVRDQANDAEYYEYYIIRAVCDAETPVSFVHDATEDPFDEWAWEDVNWCIPI